MRTLIWTLLVLLTFGCRNQTSRKQLTLAVISGAEGEALTQAARDYETQTGTHIEIAQFPYTNLFEKELIDLKSRTGAYDLIMLDDPWFPRFANENVLTELTPLLQKRGQSGPDSDFVEASLNVCRHPFQTGALYALPYVGNSQLFFYRKDLFEKHNLKELKTWDDVIAAARTINEREATGAAACGPRRDRQLVDLHPARREERRGRLRLSSLGDERRADEALGASRQSA